MCNYNTLKAILKDGSCHASGQNIIYHYLASESDIILLLLHSEVSFTSTECLVLEASSTNSLSSYIPTWLQDDALVYTVVLEKMLQVSPSNL